MRTRRYLLDCSLIFLTICFLHLVHFYLATRSPRKLSHIHTRTILPIESHWYSIGTMAFFSRKKSKAKKASKEEEKKAAAAAKAATPPVKATQRGRNGKIIAAEPAATENAMHDIPAPSQLPRHFHSPLGQDRGRTYSFEDPNHSGNDKHEYSDPHSSSDSGYASPGPESRVHSRGPSTQQSRRDREYLPISNKSMPQLTLGEELAQEPAFAEHSPPLKPSKSLHTMREDSSSDHLGPLPATPSHQYHYQDGRQQRMIQQSMPMRPSSVPAQALQPRHQRVNRPPPQRSSSPGPVLQSTHPAHSSRSRASAPPNTSSPFDWQSPITRSHHQQPSSFEPRSPTSPKAHIASPNYDQDDYSPSLNILNGLKVNRRGLILDEEGDPIGELFEGDIIDCVRQKADAYGDVLDEYGRIVGRVRTLSIRPTSSNLHRSNTNASNAGHLRGASPEPPMPLMRPAVPSSPTRMPSASRRHNTSEDEGYLVMRSHDLQESAMPQRQVNEPAEQQELSLHRHTTHENSMRRSESLPSVPESRSTAEVALSDDGSAASEESRHAATSHGSEPVSEEVASQEQVTARQGNAKSVKDATVQQPQLDIDTGEAEQSVAGVCQREETLLASTMPVINRSVSERAPPTSGLPPVPAVPKAFSELKKAVHAQPLGSFAAPSRVKTPLPAFPGRGLSVGLAGGTFGNGPMPGMPNRRLTTPGFPMSPGLNAQSSLSKPRTSTPLVRSPLSSHGESLVMSKSACAPRVPMKVTNMFTAETTPPESEQGSAQGEPRPAYNRPQGHSRSQSLKTVNTTASAAGAGKPRKVFAHAGRPNADKEADIVVQEVGDDKKTDKKKKGMKGLFARKK